MTSTHRLPTDFWPLSRFLRHAKFAENPQQANFLELRHGEVRRIPLPRTPVNRDHKGLFGSVSRLQASAWWAPASTTTPGAPTATPEATLPSASTSTADGVPDAPKDRPAANCWSSTTLEESFISLLASSEPAEMNSSSGAASGLFSSHCFISGSNCWQKPHPGFQKRTRVCWPLKSSSSTVVPSRSASFTSGEISTALGVPFTS